MHLYGLWCMCSGPVCYSAVHGCHTADVREEMCDWLGVLNGLC
jgi:hypothetical protein